MTTRYTLTVQTISVYATIPPEAEDSTVDLYIGELVRELEHRIRMTVEGMGRAYDESIPGLTFTVAAS